VGLVLFMREVFLAALSAEHVIQSQPARIERT